jgi:hypothetical protein
MTRASDAMKTVLRLIRFDMATSWGGFAGIEEEE